MLQINDTWANPTDYINKTERKKNKSVTFFMYVPLKSYAYIIHRCTKRKVFVTLSSILFIIMIGITIFLIIFFMQPKPAGELMYSEIFTETLRISFLH